MLDCRRGISGRPGKAKTGESTWLVAALLVLMMLALRGVRGWRTCLPVTHFEPVSGWLAVMLAMAGSCAARRRGRLRPASAEHQTNTTVFEKRHPTRRNGPLH
jgi:hypothetical protein